MASGVVNPDFYADFGALSTLGKQAKQNDPQAIREAARQFESLFTDMMLKSMRAAKLGDGLGDSQEGDFYQDMYDQQLAVQMSQGKGLGLAEMLVQQLTRRGALGSAAAAQAAGNSTGAAGASAGTGTAAAGAGHAGTQTKATGTQTKAKGGTSLSQRIGFVQKIAPYAQRAAVALGVSADTLIAQAALETGWGQHVLHGASRASSNSASTNDASANDTSGSDVSSNNLFGVKAGAAWQGATASATTTEYSGGSARRVAQAFRTYGSVQQGVNDYVSLLQRRAAYAGALGSGTDAKAFASALQRGGYATDPHYVDKLVATTATVRSLRSEVAAAGVNGTNVSLAAAQPAGSDDGAAALGALFKVLAGVPIQNGEEPA